MQNAVQEILSRHQQLFPLNHFAQRVNTVFSHMRECGTEAMGYHLYQCENEHCNHVKMQYHSCHDRHCPRCGQSRAQEWVESRYHDLIPCRYYHLVFTVPSELRSCFMGNMKKLYSLLFQSVSQTINTFAHDKKFLGANPGYILVLHTWGQNVHYHPHLHCIITGGGMLQDGSWKSIPHRNDGFLFPVKALRKNFRGKLLDGMEQLISSKEISLPNHFDWEFIKSKLYNTNWNVYAKLAMKGPQQVIEYLGRYTHKVAISNNRIKEINNDNHVVFDWKDYSDGDKIKTMQLELDEFVKRLSWHVLPRGFVKIRQYGLWGYRNKTARITALLKKMNLPPPAQHRVSIPFSLRMLINFQVDIFKCPACGCSSLRHVYTQHRARSPSKSLPC